MLKVLRGVITRRIVLSSTALINKRLGNNSTIRAAVCAAGNTRSFSSQWEKALSDAKDSALSKFRALTAESEEGKRKREEKEEEETQRKEKEPGASWMLIMAVAVAILYFSESETDPKQITDEKQCISKQKADAASGDVVENGGRVRRVPQGSRLPLQTLREHGVGHGLLEGTVWRDGDRYFQQTYWNDEAAFELSYEAAQQLRRATYELHSMCLEAVNLVVESDELMEIFEIPPMMREAVKRSWAERQSDLLGRMDLSWDGRGDPKLLEYSADTPTILVETSVGQALWLDMVRRERPADVCHFNSIDAALRSAWPKVFPPGAEVEFMNISPDPADMPVEEVEHIAYLKKTAAAAGLKVSPVCSLDSDMQMCRDPYAMPSTDPSSANSAENAALSATYVWKGRPYEWLAYDKTDLFTDDTGHRFVFVEPPWKLILSNKAILPLLWEMFPDHPNLLFSTYDRDHERVSNYMRSGGSVVAKPKYGREGQGVVYSKAFQDENEFIRRADEASHIRDVGFSSDPADCVYIGEPVYQEYHHTERFSDRKIVIGSWVIHGAPCGICFREDSSETTVDNSSFVPHYIPGLQDLSKESLPTPSALQSRLRWDLYKTPVDKNGKADAHPHGSTGSRGGGGGGSWWWRNWGSGQQQTTSSGTSGNAAEHKSSMYDNIKQKAKAYHAKYHKETSGTSSRYEKFKRSGQVRTKFSQQTRSRMRGGSARGRVGGFGGGRG